MTTAQQTETGYYASMGPRLFRRGNRPRGRKTTTRRKNGFNGATPFQTWKYKLRSASSRAQDRLQWGHAFSDVEMMGDFVTFADEDELQWGHAFSDVEIPYTSHSYTGSAGTPLQWGHAFSDVESKEVVIASTIQMSFNGATPFQTWKSGWIPRSIWSRSSLQWGHAFSDVEIRQDSGFGGAAGPASMGPRLFRRGNR